MKTPALLACALFAAVTIGQLQSARAEPKARAKPVKVQQATANNQAKPVKDFDFTGDNIDGRRQLPDGTTLFGLPSARHGSLIQLRGDFLPEITRAAERL